MKTNKTTDLNPDNLPREIQEFITDMIANNEWDSAANFTVDGYFVEKASITDIDDHGNMGFSGTVSGNVVIDGFHFDFKLRFGDVNDIIFFEWDGDDQQVSGRTQKSKCVCDLMRGCNCSSGQSELKAERLKLKDQ